MSLKNMKALARLCKDEAYQPEIEQMADMALEEVAALEKAAEEWGDAETGTAPKSVHDLMWTILAETRR